MSGRTNFRRAWHASLGPLCRDACACDWQRRNVPAALGSRLGDQQEVCGVYAVSAYHGSRRQHRAEPGFLLQQARHAGGHAAGRTRPASTPSSSWRRPRTSRKATAERAPLLELTYNWDPEKYGEGRNFGHLAFEVDDIYATCDRLMKAGVTINRPPRDGRMAFVRSPDNISIELLQKGAASPSRSRGRRCPTPANGEHAPASGRRLASQRIFVKI